MLTHPDDHVSVATDLAIQLACIKVGRVNSAYDCWVLNHGLPCKCTTAATPGPCLLNMLDDWPGRQVTPATTCSFHHQFGPSVSTAKLVAEMAQPFLWKQLVCPACEP